MRSTRLWPFDVADLRVRARRFGLGPSDPSGCTTSSILGPPQCCAYWTLVSACAPSCVDANMVTTAAIVWGRDALEHLGAFGYVVRLVRHDGAVIVRGGWPEAAAP